MTSKSGTMYTGMTNDLLRRVTEHKSGKGSKFTSKYNITRLAYYEEYRYVNDAIAREKQTKGLNREKKRSLIKSVNPTRKDLSADWTTNE